MYEICYTCSVLFLEGQAVLLKGSGADWLVIHIAQGGDQAQALIAALTAEGFLVRSEPAGKPGMGENAIEILALQSEAREARNFLLDSGLPT